MRSFLAASSPSFMHGEHRGQNATSQAMVVDQARRAGAARAIAAVFVVLTAAAAATLVVLGVPLALSFVMLASTAAYVGLFWLARNPERASQAGAAIVAVQLTVDFVMSLLLNKTLDEVQVAYQTALLPLIAAATLRTKGVIATGAAGGLALALEAAL